MRTWWPPRGRTADALIAVGICAVLVLLALTGDDQLDPGDTAWLAWPLIIIASGALYFRRSYPLTVAFVTLACNSVYYPFTGPDGVLVVTYLVALYTVAAEGGLLTSALLATATMLAVTSIEVNSSWRHLDKVAVFMMAGWLAATVAAGGVVQNRRAYLAEAAARVRSADLVREEEGRLRASEERLRIARELHDVIGHHISLINVQSAAALHRADPEQAMSALSAIKAASRDALRELRSTLGVLRHVDETAPVAPAPGLAVLDELVSGRRDAGLSVRTNVSGSVRALPTGIDLAAYRIVQESLTNVAKHAPSATATVSIAYGDSDLVIEVTDDGPGGTPDSTGHGILGMNERAHAVGGSLTAGPSPSGGFAVRAVLPLPEQETRP